MSFFRPVLFPNSSSYSYIVAPFWADHDPRPGQISYEIHSANTDILIVVNRFIRQQSGTAFEGSWMLLANWDDIPEYGSERDNVGRTEAYTVSPLYYAPKLPKRILQ